ncbi:MAG: hypothetical protein RL497_55 [Pseudomonadota bacterium]|jgi:hypothetical protein
MIAFKSNLWKIILICIAVCFLVYVIWPRYYIDESHSKALLVSACQQSKLYRALVLKFKTEPFFRNEIELTNLIKEINPLVGKECGESYAFEDGVFHIATGERLVGQIGLDSFAVCVIKKNLRIYDKENLSERYFLFQKTGNKIKEECAN